MKKNIPYFIFILVLMMCVGINQPPPRHIYKNRTNSIFTERVIAFVNDQFLLRCDIKSAQYIPSNETIKIRKNSFYYTLTLTPKHNNGRGSSFEIEEFHSGKLVLQKMECLGKNSQWISLNNKHSDQSAPARSIASEKE